MVAIFTGLGAGFERGSAAALGSGGLLGSGLLGRGGDNVALNAATGNLIISRQDEFLIGKGPDASVSRTYNSLGALDDNGDYWRQSTDRRVYGLTGTVNTTGSTVKRVSADGAEITYTWNATGSYYETTDGAGSYDRLTYNATTTKWTWADGDTSVSEVYQLVTAGNWRIESQADGDGNALSFTYTSDKLTRITTQDGGYIQYTWTGSNITRVESWSNSTTSYSNTTYGYDGSNRLTSVTVDLTPTNLADSVTYVTTYTYDGTSKRISTITQTDGSSLAISYYTTGTYTGWVKDLTQTVASGDTRVTAITYTDEGAGLTRSEVTDPRGQVTKLWWKNADNTGTTATDERGQLMRVMAPPAVTGGTPSEVNYTYDGSGNVLTVVTKSGATTLATVSYQYDASGNVTQITDANGNVTTRQYAATTNKLLMETRTGSYTGGSGSLYTRYVYDAEEHLTFVISAEGHVTEYVYTAGGEVQYVFEYPGDAYTIGSTLPTNAQMVTWRGGLNRTTSKILQNDYDARGNLIATTRYGASDASGGAIATEGTSTVYFSYDAGGRLLSKYNSSGSSGVAETYAYDGLGRVIVSTDAAGGRSTIVFNDAATTTTVTTQTTSGGVEQGQSYIVVSTYNKAGELISVVDSGSATGSSYTVGGTTSNVYDKNGQLRLTTDATGLRRFYLYDKSGQKIADIATDSSGSATGEIVEYRYDASGRVIATVRYANKLTTAQLTTLANPANEVEIATIRPTAHGYDIWQWNIYDAGGRVVETVLGDGSVTGYEYDASDRLVKVSNYYNKIAGATVTGYMTTSPTSVAWPTAHANDTVARTFYDRDGRVVGALSAEGYLTKIVYDEAGQKVQEIAYANATTTTYRASGTYDQLLSTVTLDAVRDISTRYVYDGQGLLRYTIDAASRVVETVYFTATTSMAVGLVRKTIAYAAALGSVANYTYATIKSAVSALASVQSDRASWSVSNSRGQLAYAISQIRSDDVSGVYHAIGTVTRYDYDAAGLVIKTTQYASTIDMYGKSVDTTAALDTWAASNGTDARITRNYYNERGELTFSVDAEGYVTQHYRDGAGRLRWTYRWSNAITVSDATLIAAVHGASKGTSVTTETRYDASGRKVEFWDANGVRNYFGYYATGKQAWEIRAFGQGMDESRTEYRYNQAGQLVRVFTHVSELTSANYVGASSVQVNGAQRLQSASTAYNAVVTREGELRLYHNGEVIWSNGVREIVSGATYRLVAQADGNLVVYRDVSGQSAVAIWSTATSYAGVTYLIMQDSGNLELRKGTVGADLGLIWSTGTTGVTGSAYATVYADTQYTYDGLGNVLTVIDQKGQTTTNTYDKVGRLLTTAKGGVTTSFAYDAFGHAGKTTDALGNASYTYYDKLGRVTLTVDAEMYAAATTYNAFGEVATVTRYANKATGTITITTQPTITANAGADAVTTYAYDKLGRVASVTDAVGGVESYTYTAFGQVATVTNKLGGVTTNTYDKLGRLVQEQLPAASYTASGTLQAATTLRKYTYDARNNRTQMIEAFGLAEQRTTNYEYDAGDRLTRTYTDALSVTSSTGTTSTVTPETRYIYDRRGNVIEQVDANGARTLFWYNRQDQVAVQLSPLGVLTRFFYDKNGNVAETRVYETAVTLPADAKGLAPAGTGAYRVTRYTYDALDRLIETRIPSIDVAAISSGTLSVTTQDLVTTNTYDGASNLVKVVDASGNASWFYYDKAGNRTTAIDAANNRIDWTYDADGNVLTEKRYYNASATPTVTTAPPAAPTAHAKDQVTTYLYDKAGRNTLTVNGEGYAVATTYNGLNEVLTVIRYAAQVTWPGGVPTVVTGAGDATTTMTYDVAGRLTNSADALNISESYVLNAFGEQVRVTNRLTGVTTYAYDKLGRMVSETLPVGAYNSAGTLVAANVVNTYEYDAAGNRTRMTEASGLAEARVTNYAYDAAGQLTRTYGVSTAVYTSSTAASSTSVTPETRSIYNLYGEVIETIDAGGGRNLFWYNKAGQLTHQLSASGTLTTFFYDKTGNTLERRTYETQLTLPANATGAAPTGTGAYRLTRFSYDALNRQIETRIPSIDTAVYAGGVLTVAAADVVMTTVYDAMGNVVKTIDANGKATWLYYDKAGHKTVQIDAENYRTDWTYDADGNVLTERRYATASTAPTATTAPPTAPSTTADDRVTTFTYDKMGRRLTETRAGVKVHNGSGGETTSNSTITYTYNALGQVLTKTEGTGEAVTYTYDTGGRLTTEARAAFTDVNGTSVTPTVDYYYNGLSDLARTRQRGTTGTIAAAERVTTYAYGTNGRLDAMTDANGFVRTYRYDAAGRVMREEYLRDPANGTEGVGYAYDIEGRVVQQSVLTTPGPTWSNAGMDVTYIQYNAFGEISAKGLNGVMAEVFAYDGAGRMWRTTSGDGTWKYFMYDKAGNQTLAITSDGTDITNQSLSAVLGLWTGGTASIATTYVDGINATITRYDGRSMGVEVLEPQREVSTTTKYDLQTQRGYNAFGEVKYEINANGAQIDYTYNTMGRQIKVESPTVSVTSEAGAVSNVRPTEYRYYDLSGRLVASKDANGNLTKLTLLAGSGYGGTQAQATEVIAADGGITRTKYDIMGDARRIESPLYNVTTAPQYVTLQSFDKMGRLVQMTRPGGLTEYYAYDGLGQRIAHANSFYNTTINTADNSTWLVAERTTFDGQGRVTLQVAPGGDTTSYGYVWSSSIATTGLGTFGGWTKTTTFTNGKTLTEVTDQFDHAVSSINLGGWTTAITYDKAGRTTLKSGDTAYGPVPLEIYYYNTGRVSKTGTSAGFADGVGIMADYNAYYTSFTYDKVGNLKTEFQDYVHNWTEFVLGDTGGGGGSYTVDHSDYYIYKNASATYDALGRIVSWTENAAAAPAATRSFEYDANGNIRRSLAVFRALDTQGNAATTTTTQDYWYRYDAMNRMVVSMGALSGGVISRGATGIDTVYDAAGNRFYTISGSGTITREDYAYDAEGRVTQVNSGSNASTIGVKRADYTYDALGRQTLQRDYATNGTTIVYSRSAVYNNKNQVTSDSSSTLRSGVTYTADSTYSYVDSSGLYYLGSLVLLTTVNKENGVTKKTNITENTYLWADSALQNTIKYTPDAAAPGTFNTSTFNYRVIGGQHQLVSVAIQDGRPRTVSFVNDMSGQSVQRDENDNSSGGDPRQIWYRYGGKQMGYVSNDGTIDTSYGASINNRTATGGTGPFFNGGTTGTSFADFDVATDQINSYFQGSQVGGYTVQQGDTLQSIATNLWGDGALWYKLAEVNGLSANSPLAEGTSLIIPAGVIRNTNSASTFRPYDPGEILGNVNPTVAPKPKKNKCGALGQILMVVIAVVVTVWTAGAAAGAMGAMASGTSVIGGALAGGAGAFTVGGALAGTGLALTTAGSVVAGAIGAAAGSIVSQAFGVATGIQDKFSWNAVALAAIGGGVGGAGNLGVQGKEWWSVGARAMVSSVVGQGVGVVTGLQRKFSWTAVAAAGVSAAATSGMNIDDLANFMGGGDVGAALAYGARGGASAIANAATRSLIDGSDFGDNVLASLPDVVGNAISSMLTDRISGATERRDVENEQQQEREAVRAILEEALLDINGKAYDRPTMAQMKEGLEEPYSDGDILNGLHDEGLTLNELGRVVVDPELLKFLSERKLDVEEFQTRQRQMIEDMFSGRDDAPQVYYDLGYTEPDGSIRYENSMARLGDPKLLDLILEHNGIKATGENRLLLVKRATGKDVTIPNTVEGNIGGAEGEIRTVIDNVASLANGLTRASIAAEAIKEFADQTGNAGLAANIGDVQAAISGGYFTMRPNSQAKIPGGVADLQQRGTGRNSELTLYQNVFKYNEGDFAESMMHELLHATTANYKMFGMFGHTEQFEYNSSPEKFYAWSNQNFIGAITPASQTKASGGNGAGQQTKSKIADNYDHAPFEGNVNNIWARDILKALKLR